MKEWIITVNGKLLQTSSGVIYNFPTFCEAYKMVDTCYGIASLKSYCNIRKPN